MRLSSAVVIAIVASIVGASVVSVGAAVAAVVGVVAVVLLIVVAVVGTAVVVAVAVIGVAVGVAPAKRAISRSWHLPIRLSIKPSDESCLVLTSECATPAALESPTKLTRASSAENRIRAVFSWGRTTKFSPNLARTTLSGAPVSRPKIQGPPNIRSGRDSTC